MSDKKHFYNSTTPILLGIAISAGILIGYFLGKKPFQNKEAKASSLIFSEVVQKISTEYVDSVDLTSLTEHAITNMVTKLDPHTRYIPKKNKPEEEAQLEQHFAGIGIEFNIVRDTILVLYTLPNGPADKAGVLSGDRITHVNSNIIVGSDVTFSSIFNALKGKVNSELELTVLRNNRSKNLTLYRGLIEQKSLDISYMLNSTTGYIKLNRFSRNSSAKFKKALTSLNQQGMTQLIFDLRSNSGGYLNEAKNIIDEMLPIGTPIVHTISRNPTDNLKFVAEINGQYENNALIVLVNENSASASEIVAGALQDNDRAIIIGRRTYGKGLVQTPLELSDGSELRLTTSRYYTPSGRCIQKPYGDNKDYYTEHINRYTTGEMFIADSMKIDDSKKFKTTNGRTVYGGGGIIPDVFVSSDTVDMSTSFSPYLAQYIITEYAIHLAHQNREQYKSMGLSSFKKTFTLTEKELNDIFAIGDTKGIRTTKKKFNSLTPQIDAWAKAQVAKEIWGNQGYFEVLHLKDNFINKALASFDLSKKILKN